MTIEWEPEHSQEGELLAAAQRGEPLGLERLLIPYQSRLLARIARKLPASLRSTISSEDVLQDAFVDVFRAIGAFRPTGRNALWRWLITIADNRLIDIVRAQAAAKRGGGFDRIDRAGDSTIAPLLDILRVHSQTPSRVVAGGEAESAVLTALDALKPDYREALRLRFIEGLSVSEAAERMRRTDWSVHKLCSRGLQRLREALGDDSAFFSR